MQEMAFPCFKFQNFLGSTPPDPPPFMCGILATHMAFSHCYPPLIYFKKCPPTGKSLKKALVTPKLQKMQPVGPVIPVQCSEPQRDTPTWLTALMVFEWRRNEPWDIIWWLSTGRRIRRSINGGATTSGIQYGVLFTLLTA